MSFTIVLRYYPIPDDDKKIFDLIGNEEADIFGAKMKIWAY
jgi:hypothetical protein